MKQPRARHAVTQSPSRAWLLNVLLIVLALGDLFIPVNGGIAPGPQIVIAFVCLGLVFRRRTAWRAFFTVAAAGCAAVGVAAWAGAWEHYLSTAQAAWGNTAAGWFVAAGTAGFAVAVLREQDRRGHVQGIEHELAAVRREIHRIAPPRAGR